METGGGAGGGVTDISHTSVFLGGNHGKGKLSLVCFDCTQFVHVNGAGEAVHDGPSARQVHVLVSRWEAASAACALMVNKWSESDAFTTQPVIISECSRGGRDQPTSSTSLLRPERKYFHVYFFEMSADVF